jgi:uncharacterized protein (TIGR02145 family)
MRTKLYKIAQAATFGLAITFTLSCSDDKDTGDTDAGDNNCGGSVVPCSGDPITIGTQTWLKCNLEVEPITGNSRCYNDDPANCVKYGRLYDWTTAMDLPSKCNSVLSTNDADCAISAKHKGVCPSNYHIPTKTEWDALVSYIESDKGCTYCAGKHLKSACGWSSGTGLDSYGFSALPGGFGFGNGRFFGSAGDDGEWWSATERSNSKDYAYKRYMDHNQDYALSGYSLKRDLSSVRCLQD